MVNAYAFVRASKCHCFDGKFHHRFGNQNMKLWMNKNNLIFDSKYVDDLDQAFEHYSIQPFGQNFWTDKIFSDFPLFFLIFMLVFLFDQKFNQKSLDLCNKVAFD